MKKNVIVILLLLFITIFASTSVLPSINYSKIEYVSYSMNHSFSVNSGNTEEVDSPNCVTIQIHLNYESMGMDSLSRPLTLDKSANESKEFSAIREEHKTKAKKYHKGKNNEILPLIEKTFYQEIYVSSYSPFIDITYDLEYFKRHQNDILELFSGNDIIESICVAESYQNYESYIDYTCNVLGAGSVYENRTWSGLGKVIGILEPGIVDVDHADLQAAWIEVKPHALNALNVADHSTQMALIICGQNGIAPDAMVLSACTYGTTITDEVEWMLDNDVDIINMSFGNANNLGTYDSMSAYVDYIMSEYYVLVVAAAGNYGESHALIDNPGLAYNAITVAACDDDDVSSDYSSYLVNSGPIKPTIGMYGGIELLDAADTFIQGTSAAAAFTTGMLGLIIEQYSGLLVNRERLYALMCANAYNPYGSYTPEDNGFINSFGAGVFHYGTMMDNYSQSGMTYSSGTVALNATIFSTSFYLAKGQKLRASIASIATSDGTVSGIQFTDYDVMIKNSSGNVVAFANSSDSIIELALYTATASGTYTLEIIQASSRIDTREYIGYAYNISN